MTTMFLLSELCRTGEDWEGQSASIDCPKCGYTMDYRVYTGWSAVLAQRKEHFSEKYAIGSINGKVASLSCPYEYCGYMREANLLDYGTGVEVEL